MVETCGGIDAEEEDKEAVCVVVAFPAAKEAGDTGVCDKGRCGAEEDREDERDEGAGPEGMGRGAEMGGEAVREAVAVAPSALAGYDATVERGEDDRGKEEPGLAATVGVGIG